MNAAPGSVPIEVLLVEDSPDDAALTTRALERAKVRNRLRVLTSGTDVLAYLRREGRFADAPVPDLILLDLNLPGRDGREVLAEIKADLALRHIPIVVVSGSREVRDVLQSYRQHANAYITKPIDAQEFLAAVNSIEQFWLQIVRLP